jgi:hypothetical protein
VDEAYRDKEQLSRCHLKAAATLFGAARLPALLRKVASGGDGWAGYSLNWRNCLESIKGD